MRNPKWHRDEIILALNLYFSTDRGSIDSSNPKVIEVSKILNKLPLFQDRPDQEKFRNPNGVSLKLSNFQHFDPDYLGKGMDAGSKLDKIVFNEFYNRRDELRVIADEIKKVADDSHLLIKIAAIEDDEQSKNDSVTEGQILYKLHKVRERDSKINKLKKALVLSHTGKLSCEVCEFEFGQYYGELGEGFIECHHRTPLANFKAETKTTLDDLALVCANCHRMLHRKIDLLTIEGLRMCIIEKFQNLAPIDN